ncbi:TRAP transporter substrate-binding protein [Neoaquamicrobium sediminum]|uniref:TRAP transporter substrate-binding protein n=1 Tax=Neoaquamicrobium sediminum TaxID=1849104 RepID=UPI003BA8FB7A
MTVTRRSLLAGFTATLALPAVTGRAAAQTPLVVASLLGDDKPETLVWNHIRDLVEAEMPGAFTFNIVPNAALGGEKEVVEGMRLGSIQASLSTLSNLTAWMPECILFDLPFLFRDDAHLAAALRSATAGRLKEQIEQEGLIAPAFIDYGARHLLAPLPLLEPGAMNGKRIRVIQSRLHAELWQRFGALPIALPITETYNALSTGHVDAMDLTISAYAGFRLNEVGPHVTLTGHITAVGAVIFAASFWQQIDPQRRDVLQRAAEAGAEHFNALMRQEERRSMDVTKAAGAHFHTIADRPAWEAPAREIWTLFAEQAGGLERIEEIAGI